MNCVALVRHFSSLGQAPGLSSFKGIRCTVVLRCVVAVDDCRDERTVNASVPPMPGDGNPKLWDQPLNVARGHAMRSGLWYGFGLVTAAGLAVLWKSPLTSRFLLFLFSRGDR